MWPFQQTTTSRTLPKLPPIPEGAALPHPTSAISLPKLPEELSEPDIPLPPPQPAENTPQELPETLLPAVVPAEPDPLPSEMPLESIPLWLSNGVIVRSLEDLAEALSAMSDATFHYHVNVERNDLASWVQDVIGDKELAMKLATIHHRQDFLSVVQNRLGAIPRKTKDDGKKFAYLGLRGMASSLENYTPKGTQRKEGGASRAEPESTPSLKQKYAPAGGSEASQKALRSLDSMQDAQYLIARLQPRGTMLAEMLKKKREAREKKIAAQPMLAAPARHEALPAPRIAPAPPKKLEPLPKLEPKKPRLTKAQLEAEQQALLVEALEEAKRAAEQNDLVAARQLLAKAKSIIKLHFRGNSKPFQYYIWDAENSMRRAQLSSV